MKKTPRNQNGFNVVTENKDKNLTENYVLNILSFIWYSFILCVASWQILRKYVIVADLK